ncbi:YfjI family protein [Serratia fonticola]|uniref:YfjI family protein n=1 Tax=Serratia fonticola TaxID=47917 RepID=UPI003BB58BA3
MSEKSSNDLAEVFYYDDGEESPLILTQKLPDSSEPQSQQQPLSFPVEDLVPLLQNVVNEIQRDYQLPVGMIVNVLLAAASYGCQSFIEIIQPQNIDSEPCTLYVMTIAESGSGKTTLSNLVMKPIFDFVSEMSILHEMRLSSFNTELRLWKNEQKYLDNLVKKAFGDPVAAEKAKNQSRAHDQLKPKKPVCPSIVFEDSSLKSLAEGLNEYSEAAIITDEAHSFFNNSTNNQALLNKAWDGGLYVYGRGKRDEYKFQPLLTISLMTQPGIFDIFLEKKDSTAYKSGFLSRFLYFIFDGVIEQTDNSVPLDSSRPALEFFHKKLTALLEKQKFRIFGDASEKSLVGLTEGAKALYHEKRSEIVQEIQPGGKWEHIKPSALKSQAMALRIAAIQQYIQDESVCDIDESTLSSAFNIMNWYLQQVHNLFYPMTDEYKKKHQFVQNVYGLYKWIRGGNGHRPFPKKDILQKGPRFARTAELLAPLLEQLISQGEIAIIRSTETGASSTEYVSWPSVNPSEVSPYDDIPGRSIMGDRQERRYIIVRDKNNTRGQGPYVDISDIRIRHTYKPS